MFVCLCVCVFVCFGMPLPLIIKTPHRLAIFCFWGACKDHPPPFGVWDPPSGTLLPEFQSANPLEITRIRPLRPSNNKAPERKLS